MMNRPISIAYVLFCRKSVHVIPYYRGRLSVLERPSVYVDHKAIALRKRPTLERGGCHDFAHHMHVFLWAFSGCAFGSLACFASPRFWRVPLLWVITISFCASFPHSFKQWSYVVSVLILNWVALAFGSRKTLAICLSLLFACLGLWWVWLSDYLSVFRFWQVISLYALIGFVLLGF